MHPGEVANITDEQFDAMRQLAREKYRGCRKIDLFVVLSNDLVVTIYNSSADRVAQIYLDPDGVEVV